MSTPIEIIKHNVPECIEMHMQKYVSNDYSKQALSEYFDHLFYKKELYERFVLDNYITPRCTCNNFPDSGLPKMFSNRYCSACFEFESNYYSLKDYEMCIEYNPQFNKIYYD
jgi:hypothetical protein